MPLIFLEAFGAEKENHSTSKPQFGIFHGAYPGKHRAEGEWAWWGGVVSVLVDAAGEEARNREWLV